MTRKTIDGPTLNMERLFKAPIEKVWSMWTTKESLEKWYWPAPLVAKVLHSTCALAAALRSPPLDYPPPLEARSRRL
jgi:hypothetical protein